MMASAQDGAHLYPAFPYTYYTKLTRGDTDAIYAFLRTLPPAEHLVDRDTLPFPFDIRASMVAWNAMFFTPGSFVPDPQKSDEFNRGAYSGAGRGALRRVPHAVQCAGREQVVPVPGGQPGRPMDGAEHHR